jgi:hypothetical protein
MRTLYAEGDLICAEVHQFFQARHPPYPMRRGTHRPPIAQTGSPALGASWHRHSAAAGHTGLANSESQAISIRAAARAA